MISKIKYELKRESFGLLHNLVNSSRAIIFKRVAISDFYVSDNQVVLLTFIFSVIIFCISLLFALPEPEFNLYGTTDIITRLFFLNLLAFSFSKINDQEHFFIALFIFLMFIYIIFNGVWMLISFKNGFNIWHFLGSHKYLYGVIQLAMSGVIIFAVARVLYASLAQIFLIVILYLFLFLIPIHYLSFDSFWYKAYLPDEKQQLHEALNQENLYYRQFELLKKQLTALLPQRKGKRDVYFVGFASYAKQDVFMKEVIYGRALFDKKFNTKGRSVVLINNIKTVKDQLLATQHNLDRVLDHLGSIMDRNEDLLFLYLTSHGSKQHRLSANMRPLTLNTVTPANLKSSLKKSGIKYRIILVSACYSGGYIEPLKDAYSIIFTASAKNRTSFGCGNNNEFTYFGEAVFKDQLQKNTDYIPAFVQVIKAIRKRETSEKLTHSLPQLFIGTKIRAKLSR